MRVDGAPERPEDGLTSRSSGQHSAPGAAEGDGKRRGPHRHLVLLVEDNVDLQIAMQVLLRLEGFQLVTAADGAAGFELLQRGTTPCLILLDLTMPVSDGRDFRRHQLQDPRFAAIPTVLFSAHDGIAQRASELGITDFLSKPADFDALTDMVRRQCTGCAATDATGERSAGDPPGS